MVLEKSPQGVILPTLPTEAPHSSNILCSHNTAPATGLQVCKSPAFVCAGLSVGRPPHPLLPQAGESPLPFTLGGLTQSEPPWDASSPPQGWVSIPPLGSAALPSPLL